MKCESHSEDARVQFWTWKGREASTRARTSDKFEVDDIAVAFVVRIGMAEEATMSLDAQWRSRFEASSTYFATPNVMRVFHHMFLDFACKSCFAPVTNWSTQNPIRRRIRSRTLYFQRPRRRLGRLGPISGYSQLRAAIPPYTRAGWLSYCPLGPGVLTRYIIYLSPHQRHLSSSVSARHRRTKLSTKAQISGYAGHCCAWDMP